MKPADAVVGAQMLAMAALAWPGRPRWRLPGPVGAGAVGLIGLGGALSLAGARDHGAQLTPGVDPPDGARLLTDGAYRYSRNPIYAGLLLAGSGFAVLRRRPEPLVALAALSAVLHVKATMEESSLGRRFGAAYDEYAARTPRLLGPPR